MTDKEKLAKIVYSAASRLVEEEANIVAHRLIENGVMVQKHGRWIPTTISNSTGPIVRCSVCGQYINPSGTAIELKRQELEPRFCEKCGARMDGERKGDGNG